MVNWSEQAVNIQRLDGSDSTQMQGLCCQRVSFVLQSTGPLTTLLNAPNQLRLHEQARGVMITVHNGGADTPGGICQDEHKLAPCVQPDGHQAVVLGLEVLDALQFRRTPESPLIVCPTQPTLFEIQINTALPPTSCTP